MNSKYLVNGLFILCYSMFLMFMSACYNELETLLLITRKKILCQQKLEEMTLAGVAAERNIRPVMRHLI